jgi:hypothetical protein
MPCGVGHELRGVGGSSASDVFAVGQGGAILHYGGAAMYPVYLPLVLDGGTP